MNPNRLNELAAAWSADDPDPARRAELEELLRRDPDARRQFLDFCVGEMALVDSLASATATPNPAPAPMRVSPRRRDFRAAPPRRRWVVAARVAAAGLVAAALVLGLIPLLFPGDRSPRIAAGSLIVDHREISAGSPVTFPLTNAKAGEHGVELSDPAGINLHAAPGSTFAIAAPGAIHLELGQLIVDVDSSRAPPTAVRTSELVARVTGTRFVVTRNPDWSEVEVERGHVSVKTDNGAVRDLTAGTHIAADQLGFIIEQPADRAGKPALLDLVLVTRTGGDRSHHAPDQPIHLPANQPLTLRAETSPGVVSMRFKLANEVIIGLRPDGLERVAPFYLWGDLDWGKYPNFSKLPAGTHQLTITCFADHRGARPLETRQVTLIAE